jgi:hypothetical protein
MKLFTINKTTNDIEVSNSYILGTPEFKALIESKTYNSSVLLYVFFMADWSGENWLAGYQEEERSIKAIKESGVFPSLVTNKTVVAAIDKYVEIQQNLSPSISALITAKLTLRQATNFLVDITKQNEILKLNIDKLTELAAESNDTIETSKVISQINTFNSAIKNNIGDLLNIVNNIAKTIGDIEKLELKVREEYKEQIERVGSKRFGGREKPGYIIMPKDT